uniref:hypothetical protein n=1 Tax=Xenorhabdus beddingii TaxID=40578 RepID=UPI000A323628
MSSYISKVIVFFIFIYALLISTTIINAFADGNITTNKISSQQTDQKENIDVRVNESSKIFFDSNTNQENDVKKNSDTSNADTPNIITRNLQTVSNILSSSPAELAEQAKSYALGKFNRTVASEAQKWLSQF